MLIIYDTPILPFSAIGGFSLSTTDTGICIMYSPSTCTLSCQSLTPVPISVFSLHCLAYAIMPVTSKHIMQRFPLSNIELFGLYHLWYCCFWKKRKYTLGRIYVVHIISQPIPLPRPPPTTKINQIKSSKNEKQNFGYFGANYFGGSIHATICTIIF